MNFSATTLEGVVICQPQVYRDARGFFAEVFKAEVFAREVTTRPFIQENHSRSRLGVLRGLHLQIGENAQGKLVRAARGKVLDVLLDLRRSSSTFGQSLAVELDDTEHRQVYVPPGIAHGFQVLSPEADLIYLVDAPYDPAAERGVLWQDPRVAKRWHDLPVEPIISEKDKKLPIWDPQLLYFSKDR
jgi:dTDP-4-dehydrorhamnose 3,5-epimerase